MEISYDGSKFYGFQRLNPMHTYKLQFRYDGLEFIAELDNPTATNGITDISDNIKNRITAYELSKSDGNVNDKAKGREEVNDFFKDIDKMKEVAKLFLGVHDFHNFVSGTRKDSTCIIYDISFKKDKDILNIIFEGKSFYRYMVRNLVGAMIDVARGKDDISLVKKRLESKDNINGYTAPACGLYLDKIEY